jgi:ParB-like chromosome segregation protein Spo0J
VLEHVNLDKILTDRHYSDAIYDDILMGNLKSSLLRYGQMEPVTLAVKGNKYLLVKGRRLFRAAGELGWKQIIAEVYYLSDKGIEETRKLNTSTVEPL